MKVHTSSVTNTTPVAMSKPFVPSRSLLSSFSQSLRVDRTIPCSIPRQCARWASSTTRPMVTPRATQSNKPCRKATSESFTAARKGFSTTASQQYKTVQEQRSRHRSGVRPQHAIALSRWALTDWYGVVALLMDRWCSLPLGWRWIGLLLPLWERAHGAKACCRSSKGCWTAQSGWSIWTPGPGRTTIYRGEPKRKICTGGCWPAELMLEYCADER